MITEAELGKRSWKTLAIDMTIMTDVAEYRASVGDTKNQAILLGNIERLKAEVRRRMAEKAFARAKEKSKPCPE